jgi:hypothetical protein
MSATFYFSEINSRLRNPWGLLRVLIPFTFVARRIYFVELQVFTTWRRRTDEKITCHRRERPASVSVGVCLDLYDSAIAVPGSA